MIVGFDLLGLAHKKFDVKTAIRCTPEGYALGVFDDPFGNVMPKLRKMLATGKYPVVRIHAHWDNNHKIVPLPKLRQKLPRYEKLAKDFPNVKVYVSPSCERREYPMSVVKQRFDLVKKLAPSCIAVDSVMRGAAYPGVIAEHHGDITVKPGEIVSHDGINSYDIDIESWRKRNSGALIQFFWGFRFNLREIPDPGEKVPPPALRTAAPSYEYMRSIEWISKPLPAFDAPLFDGKVIPFKDGRLYKSHAEDSQGTDNPRENKPCIIIPNNLKTITVIDRKGRKISTLTYGGTFPGRKHRYYSTEWGWNLSDVALSCSGSQTVWIKAGDQVYGPVNGGFRAGGFR